MLQQRPLTFNQERLLLIYEAHERNGQACRYLNFPLLFEFCGPPDRGAIEQALNCLVHRYSALRTAYLPTSAYSATARAMLLTTFARTGLWIPGLYAPLVVPRCSVTIRTARVPHDDTPTELSRIVEEDVRAPFCLLEPPLLRAILVDDRSDRHCLVLTVSHLAADGSAIAILSRSLQHFYSASLAGETLPAENESFSQMDFSAWQYSHFRSGGFARERAHWESVWALARDAQIGIDDVPFAVQPSCGCACGVSVAERVLSADESIRVRTAAARQGVTPYVLMRTAFTIVMHHLTKRPRIALWAFFANREPHTRDMVGWCSQAHIIDTDVGADPTAGELCRSVSSRIRQAQSCQAMPLPALWLTLGRRLETFGTRVTFDMWRLPRPRTGEALTPVLCQGGRPWSDLDVRAIDHGAHFALGASYDSSKYSTAGIERLLDSLHRVAVTLAGSFDQRVSRFTGE